MIYPTTLLDAEIGRLTQAIHTNGLSLLYLVRQAMPKLSLRRDCSPGAMPTSDLRPFLPPIKNLYLLQISRLSEVLIALPWIRCPRGGDVSSPV